MTDESIGRSMKKCVNIAAAATSCVAAAAEAEPLAAAAIVTGLPGTTLSTPSTTTRSPACSPWTTTMFLVADVVADDDRPHFGDVVRVDDVDQMPVAALLDRQLRDDDRVRACRAVQDGGHEHPRTQLPFGIGQHRANHE